MRTQRRTKAVGYVRVSSEQQATEGVSLDAQRCKMRAYCKAMDIDLIDIIADEGYSASNLKRPGLRAALAMLRNGQASTLIIVKLDRLTRCVKDLGTLCEQYFSDEKAYTLMSLSDSIDTRSASGKLVLNVLTSVAQWEREAIADRTKEAMAHLKEQGVRVGGVPYGWRYSSEVDANGRRLVVKHPEEQKAIRRICALHLKQIPAPQIVQRLEQEGLPSRGKRWHTRSVYQVLQRSGHAVRTYRQDAPRVQPTVLELKRDKQAAAQRAMQLRAQRLSLRDIGARLLGEGLLPARGARWYAATVLDLLPRVASGLSAGAPGSTRPASKRSHHEPALGRPASRATARPASERAGARASAQAEPPRKRAQVEVCERSTPTRPAAKSSSLPARRAAADARPRAQAG
ncbi:MAG TPA: recombinase family protein [Pseudomonadota bacterium]|nr:recombinase family protein [Pseudomonadota bacterium]